MKKEYIVGAPKSVLERVHIHRDAKEHRIIQPGFHFIDRDLREYLLDSIQDHCDIKARFRFEKDKESRHFIVYDTVLRLFNNVPEILVYQRTSKAGEEKLGGMFSVGVGGHVEKRDTEGPGVEKSMLPLVKTLNNASIRELAEELTQPIVEHEAVAKIYRQAIIVDDSDEVGQVHIGFVNIWSITPEWAEVNVKADKEHIQHGFMPLNREALLGQLKFENWSTMIIEALIDDPLVA